VDGQRRHLSSSSSSSLIVDGPRRYLLSSSSSSIVDGTCWYFLSLSLSTVGAATSSPLVIVGHGWAVPHPFVGCGWSVLPPPLHHRSWRVGAHQWKPCSCIILGSYPSYMIYPQGQLPSWATAQASYIISAEGCTALGEAGKDVGRVLGPPIT